MFEGCDQVSLPEALRPTLAVVIDTEEEFDWNADFSRSATDVSAIRQVERLQAVFDEYNVCPVYVVDYPVASQLDGPAALKPIVEDGRALIGAHCHPWVNPPFDEAVNSFNSYQGNLEESLEREKLRILKDVIETNFDLTPIIHKAGRYGAGPNTAKIIEELGFEIDVSLAPGFDWGGDGGPNQSALTQDLFWFGKHKNLLGIPNSGGFVGSLRSRGPLLHSAVRAKHPFWSLFNRVLSKAKMLERILLSPEGYSLDENKRLSKAMLSWGYRVFVYSLHSPTIKPGRTPYTHSERDVQIFLDDCRQYLDFFFDTLGGQCLTPIELRNLLLSAKS